MADLGEEAYSSQMKVIATFLRLLEELMRNKQQDLRYGTKTQRRGIFRRMKDFVGGVFKKVYDGTFGRLSRNGKDYGQLDLNDPAVAKLFADTMKQMGMDTMHEDNNLLFSTSDIAKIMAFSKMVEQELGKKIEHENDTPEKEQSQEHGQDHEKQADARDWSDYPATPEQIELTATVLAADEGVSIDEIKKDFSENPSIGELQIALEAKGHDTMAIQPDLRNYATPEQRAQLDMLKDKGVIGEDELMQLGNCDILMCILAEQAGNRKYQTSTLQKPLSRKLRIWNLGENARLRCSVIFVAPNFLVMEISEQRNS